MIVIKNNWLLKVNLWITIHFGRNPKNGGRPPRDNRLRNRENLRVFEEKNTLNSWFKWNNLNISKKYTRLKDSRVYMKK